MKRIKVQTLIKTENVNLATLEKQIRKDLISFVKSKKADNLPLWIAMGVFDLLTEVVANKEEK